VRVVPAGPLLAGRSGKCGALVSGVKHARGEWLLFTDADTIHEPGSLARALGEAKRAGAALLSYSPAQETRTFVERAVMPLVFAELAGRYKPAEVCDPDCDIAAANGQYLLIRRDVYQQVGGHAAVADTILEDVALAQRVKRAGGKLLFRFGGDAVRTRMYRSFAQLREGWTKNLALLFPDALALATRRSMEFIGIFGGFVLGAWSVYQGFAAGLYFAVAALSLLALFLRRVARAHMGAMNTALALLGLPIFSYLLLRSFIHYRGGRSITWKGRSYSTPRTSQTRTSAMPEATHH
jgi:cellulose synthase/poly-beta-1,6-N-acetylglucosamine synthase-like glycosyltransferase